VTRELGVKLVSPKVWRPLVEKRFGALTPQEQRFARSVVATMHNRHVGLTPELAAGLVRLLLDPNAQMQVGGAWSAVHKRLADELLIGKEGSNLARLPASKRGLGLLLGSVPTYSIIRLAMPIVEEACRRIGHCYLFCGDKVKFSVPKDEYDAYAKELTGAIIQLARDSDDRLKLFWQDRALALASLSHSSVFFGQTSAALPEVEPSALDLLLHLKPDISPSKRRAQHSLRLTIASGHRRNPRLKEGGIEGIRVSRRIEDMDSMLLSEYTYPEIIRLDRLVNTGFLALQRESRDQRMRDVLIAALMPGQVRARLSADLVKACWFDCVMRLSPILCRYRLYQSEFRWIEGDTFDRARTCTFLLQDMPAFHTTSENRPSKAYRRAFLTSLHWLPAYLDTRACFNSLADCNERIKSDLDTSDIARLRDWAYCAWADQKDHVHWAQRGDRASRRGRAASNWLRTDEFAYVHVMLFLPARERGKGSQGAPTSLGQLYAGLGLGNQPGRNVSITWVPSRIASDQTENSEAWAFDAHLRLDPLLFRSPQSDGREIAGRLVQAWFDQWIKEMGRG